jgi:hypothetical protein
LSAFQFADDFASHLKATGSTAGYSGPCWSPWLWFDIDAEGDLHRAHREAGRLTLTIYERYAPGDDDLLIFFSGAKGFHIGLPTAIWSPSPSLDFAKTARKFAEHAAERATVTIDAGVYDRVRAFRAPNSRHPKTGLHKRRFALDELTGLSVERIVEISREPAPFDLPEPTAKSETAAADWQAALALLSDESEAKAARRAAGNGRPTLNRSTLDYLRNGAEQGDRHRLLFSAAANLAEFGCSPALAVALLEESALDSGLPPKEVRRQIECGLNNGGQWPVVGGQQETSPAAVATDELPPLPEPLAPLPPGAVGSGTLDKSCKCGSTQFVDIGLSEGRSRRDCRKCGRFIGWGKWYENGGPTP